MTDILDAPVLPPEPPAPRRNPTSIVVAVVAAVAVIALAVVAIFAVTNDNDGDATDTHMMGGSSMDGMMSHAVANATIPGARDIAVTATSFTFTPSEIHVRAGEDVNIALAATDVGHDFTIDGLAFHIAAEPGTGGRGGLHVPSTPGRYTAYCSVAGHRAAGMTATVVIDES